MRLLANRDGTVRTRTTDEGGTLTTADGTVSVSVTNPDGDVVASGNASEETTGVYAFTVPAQTELDDLTAEFSGAVGGNSFTQTEQVTIVERRLAPLYQLREDTELESLSTTAILRLADQVEDWFDDALKFPAVRRGARVKWEAPVSRRLRIPGVVRPGTLYSLTQAGDAMDLADVEVREGALYLTGGGSNLSFLTGLPAGSGGHFAAAIYEAHLSHGLESPPADLVRAAATFARYVSRSSNYPERARQVATEGAVITFSMPTPDRPTGLPEVDGVLNRLRHEIVV